MKWGNGMRWKGREIEKDDVAVFTEDLSFLVNPYANFNGLFRNKVLL